MIDSVWLVRLYVKAKPAVPVDPTSSRVVMFRFWTVQLGTLAHGSRGAPDAPRLLTSAIVVAMSSGRIIGSMIDLRAGYRGKRVLQLGLCDFLLSSNNLLDAHRGSGGLIDSST